MLWLILALIVPVVVAWLNGSTYQFAFTVIVLGVTLYVGNVSLIRYFIKRRAPSNLTDNSWESTAGRGIVPKWVSALGLIALGLVPSGFIVTLLLWLGFITDKAR